MWLVGLLRSILFLICHVGLFKLNYFVSSCSISHRQLQSTNDDGSSAESNSIVLSYTVQVNEANGVNYDTLTSTLNAAVANGEYLHCLACIKYFD